MLNAFLIDFLPPLSSDGRFPHTRSTTQWCESHSCSEEGTCSTHKKWENCFVNLSHIRIIIIINIRNMQRNRKKGRKLINFIPSAWARACESASNSTKLSISCSVLFNFLLLFLSPCSVIDDGSSEKPLYFDALHSFNHPEHVFKHNLPCNVNTNVCGQKTALLIFQWVPSLLFNNHFQFHSCYFNLTNRKSSAAASHNIAHTLSLAEDETNVGSFVHRPILILWLSGLTP